MAGTNSGCGKTTVSIGLMALLASRGMRVAPFKTGPDFIDTAFHTVASGATSHNLDSFMFDKAVARQLFTKHTNGSDIAVVEGVMGLYDGLGDTSEGSTAELAKLLQLPVILVVNCVGLYQSVGALVAGFAQFDKEVNVAGVILNNISGGDHFAFMKSYIETHTGIACVGYLPHNGAISLESRHLGLVQAEEDGELKKKIALLAAQLSESIDVEKLMAISEFEPSWMVDTKVLAPWKHNLTGLRLGVARDKAFRFYYADNLELLVESGVEIVEFSPLTSGYLPENLDALYLGGGYPEIFGRALEANARLRDEIRDAVEGGMPVFAECGGLMYLTNEIKTLEGESFAMCGVYNCVSQMTKRLQRFGYCDVVWDGAITRSHEFHHSQLELEADNEEYRFDFSIHKPYKTALWSGGLRFNQALAGYPHIHFYSNADFYHKLIDLWMQRIIPS